MLVVGLKLTIILQNVGECSGLRPLIQTGKRAHFLVEYGVLRTPYKRKNWLRLAGNHYRRRLR